MVHFWGSSTVKPRLRAQSSTREARIQRATAHVFKLINPRSPSCHLHLHGPPLHRQPEGRLSNPTPPMPLPSTPLISVMPPPFLRAPLHCQLEARLRSPPRPCRFHPHGGRAVRNLVCTPLVSSPVKRGSVDSNGLQGGGGHRFASRSGHVSRDEAVGEKRTALQHESTCPTRGYL